MGSSSYGKKRDYAAIGNAVLKLKKKRMPWANETTEILWDSECSLYFSLVTAKHCGLKIDDDLLHSVVNSTCFEAQVCQMTDEEFEKLLNEDKIK